MTQLALASRLDLSAVQPLATALRERSGADLVIDASDVSHLGALGLQVLGAAAISWRAAGHRLQIAPRSDAFDAALQTFGIPLSALESEPVP
ncbi:STAS domain-containing protein [Phaeovulum sp. NW3]|uniref:STAS domain-containing protein n=1 Tax=Phaeovulum sp. NW3 TaxID=2934933 RepID=UPI0020205796|nr:STAS domain-containing protein [Phaeovulum sp. NW3]MCL7464044.1 STAS domain-containing protein [Phaeovulum sp. NW3]